MVGKGFPIAGFLLATLATARVWVPATWWRLLAAIDAGLLLILMGLFFGPTRLLPIAFALRTLYVALVRPTLY